jgi:putative FmdB family regulatory protein
MPLYEYECESCHHRFEKIQKFSDPPEEVCPKCGGRVRKLLSSPAIQFKGSGWYITDYAKKSSSGSDSGKAAASTDKADGSKSEKPDSKGGTSSAPGASTSDSSAKKDTKAT